MFLCLLCFAWFSQNSDLLQEAEHLITAPRPRCMMEAGHLGRVEPGTPTIQTHHQGKKRTCVLSASLTQH